MFHISPTTSEDNISSTNVVDNNKEDICAFNDMDEIIKELIESDNIFLRIFCFTNNTPDDYREAANKLKQYYPQYDFQTLLAHVGKEHENNITEDIHKIDKIYDPEKKKYYNPSIVAATKKPKEDVFNMIKFLNESISNNQCVPLSFETENNDEDYDDYERDIFQQGHVIVEYSIRSIARLCLVVNNLRELPYNILDLNPIRSID